MHTHRLLQPTKFVEINTIKRNRYRTQPCFFNRYRWIVPSGIDYFIIRSHRSYWILELSSRTTNILHTLCAIRIAFIWLLFSVVCSESFRFYLFIITWPSVRACIWQRISWTFFLLLGYDFRWSGMVCNKIANTWWFVRAIIIV